MNFKSQPLCIAPAFLDLIAEYAAQPRQRHSASFAPPKGSRWVFEELIGILEPALNQPLTTRLLRYAADDSVAGVVLYIDSGGGLVSSTPELSEAVRRVARKKPIHVVAENYLCSGAMWVASQATSIVASPSTLIGAVGCIFILLDESAMFQSLGVKVITIASSELKSLGVPGVPVSAEHIAVLRRLSDVTFANFESAVARGRKLTGDALAAVSTGDVWYAATAKLKGLIDDMQLFDDAMGKIVANMSVEKYADLTGRAALEQLLALANAGQSDDEEFFDLEDVLPSINARITKQFPSLAAAAREYESSPATAAGRRYR